MLLLLGSIALAGGFLDWQAERPAPIAAPAPATGYREADEVWAEIAEQMRLRPGVVRAEEIGESVAGRPIWAFHVADPASTPDRRVLVFGGIHALEWISTEVATDLLLEWASCPPPGVALTVIPVLNPDGRAHVEQDLAAGENRYRRGNDRHVDLNRDFAVNTEPRAVWKSVIPGRYAHSDAPFSQPESEALDALDSREHFDRAASLHSFGGYLYFPWTGRWGRPDDFSELERLGRAMEAAQAGHAYRTAQLSRWGFFFRAQGTEIDDLYGRYGTEAFLIELTRSGLVFWRPREWNTYFRWYNPVDPAPHRARGLAAVRALALAP
jgi:hypothetical protein